MQKTGFEPVISGKPVVLILGSMPGEASLAEQQYYAYKHNAFWPIMGQLFNFADTLAYQEKIAKLIQNRIALWDVIGQCQRKGSLDSAIQAESIIVNDLPGLFTTYNSIQHVIFNGQKAQQEFKRRVLPDIKRQYSEIDYHTMPSTSPANARLRFADKLGAWSLIKTLLS